VVPNGLINGTNTFDCSGSSDPACLGGGKRFELTFEKGKKYRIGLVGTQGDGYLRFGIDGHKLTVIANDLVPVVPYVTDSVVLGGGQRYDVIIEADQAVGNYWLRSIVQDCNVIVNSAWNDIRGIVRYEGVADSTADPTTTTSIPLACYDRALASLVPWLKKPVGSAVEQEEFGVTWYYDSPGGLIYHWAINGQALEIDWAEPTLKLISNGTSVFPASYSVKEITAVNQVRPPPPLSLKCDKTREGKLTAQVGILHHSRCLAFRCFPPNPSPWPRLPRRSHRHRDLHPWSHAAESQQSATERYGCCARKWLSRNCVLD
jgi:hypothetical protein